MYLTKEDYLIARGINLAIELKNAPNDNDSNYEEIFLSMIEENLINYMKAHFAVNDKLIASQPEAMKKAMILQVDWYLKNGDPSLAVDDLGNPIEELHPRTKSILKMYGLANTVTSSDYEFLKGVRRTKWR